MGVIDRKKRRYSFNGKRVEQMDVVRKISHTDLVLRPEWQEADQTKRPFAEVTACLDWRQGDA